MLVTISQSNPTNFLYQFLVMCAVEKFENVLCQSPSEILTNNSNCHEITVEKL